MNKKLALYGFSSLGVLIFLAISYFLYSYSQSVILDAAIPSPPSTEKNLTSLPDRSEWVGRFAKQDPKDFAYPATELQIKLDLVGHMEHEKVYRIVIGDVDSYKFFCINQVLSSNGIKYSYYRTDGFVRLIIATSDRKYMEQVLSELEDYGIEYKIETTLKQG